ncbi:MAG: tRNA uridine-5-carboxymethylaminomethyl(34) synthesis GTPase MnmE [Chitinophagales bacterium]|nr:tRNA uridine-5-carboxymethylaminomethyl(34) synthesis GTPase MnmE [Bacteroidota bacterium]MCB9043391.1 tRNA uridine-5-carboxymethylaminomethyl(34) synthesis GTPase MnmE [Chitinophagales bacterium]
MTNLNKQDTIVALSTPQGSSALAVIRLSGENAIAVANKVFKGKNLLKVASHTIHYGFFMDKNEVIDEVMVAVLRAPRTFTTQDTIEISCHGSMYVANKMIEVLLQNGARLAEAGEFTRRAFLFGRIDLSQAEAVADIIAAETQSQHHLAIQQMRGGFSQKIALLRQELIDFTALLELELDFSEEDVAFADRSKLANLVEQIIAEIETLIDSFRYGNVIKKGVPVAIIGAPNVGKSTLLNALLQEEKAIVSDIAGTTRDFIEDHLVIDGVLFRFIDTAGIRETSDTLEVLGIARSWQKLQSAQIVLYLADIEEPFKETAAAVNAIPLQKNQSLIVLLNKSDKMVDCHAYDVEESIATLTGKTTLEISAKTQRNVDKLKKILIDLVLRHSKNTSDVQVSNIRHYEALQKALVALQNVRQHLSENLSNEFMSQDLREALDGLAVISGEISNEDVLDSIFSRFCIGK